MRNLNVHKTTYKISDFIAWQQQRTLVLNPKFQRRGVWKPGAKSFLIDTIIKGLPIPVIILRDVRTDLKTLRSKKEVVDGQQRLRTLLSFIAADLLSDYNETQDKFVLRNSHLPEFSSMKFVDLPSEIQQRILDYQFFVETLPAETDDKEILEIFARMNSTGVKLNKQELRNSQFFGEFKTLAYHLSLEFYDYWEKWQLFNNDKITRMAEVELVNDLLILTLSGIQQRTPSLIDEYYENFDEEFSNRDIVEFRVRTVMEFIDASVGDIISDTLFKKTALFHGLFAFIYDRMFELNSQLMSKKPKQLKNINLKESLIKINNDLKTNKPVEVTNSYKTATNTRHSREIIYQYIKSCFQQ